MACIKQLPAHEAHKIAAGEVVERPANVVKELIENALDAGATRIDVAIEDAGKKLIRVVDNGCGMGADDAQLCFAHHATSKITGVDDLDTLQTFGFRGEALSSIAAVSDVTLITRLHAQALGVEYALSYGQPVAPAPVEVACQPGTMLSVRDLFANVPARKKFLKQRDTEWRQIVQLFQAFCLARKDVHFSLSHDGDLVHNCPAAADDTARIAQLWGSGLAQAMLAVEHAQSAESVSISGVVSNHEVARYNRNQLFFFVNGRWIKNQSLSRALLKGYLNVLQSGKYPAACIFITVPSQQVDVNIHPRKDEVRFLHPHIVERAIQGSVKQALERGLSARLGHKTVATQAPFVERAPFQAFPFNGAERKPFDFKDLQLLHATRTASNTVVVPSGTPLAPVILPTSPLFAHALPVQQEPASANQDPLTEQISLHTGTQEVPVAYRLIGQLRKTYILLEKEEGLVVVDQHAAHERVLYERFTNRMSDTDTVRFLFPHLVTLTQADVAHVAEHATLFMHYGIEIELSGPSQLMVKSAPVHLKNADFGELLRELASWMVEYNGLDEREFTERLNKKLCAQMACKAAVKAGDDLTQEQMHQLIADLDKTENRFACPHGRPTCWQMGVYEIEKKFKRRL